MADRIDFDITGIEGLTKKLNSVSNDVKYKGGRFALRKAANLIAGKLKENASRLDDPETAEDIAKNVAVRWSGRRFRRTGDLMFRVGILGGAGGRATSEELSGLPGKDTRHWRHLEFGNERVAARPFARKSLENNVSAATSEFTRQYERALDRAIKRASK